MVLSLSVSPLPKRFQGHPDVRYYLIVRACASLPEGETDTVKMLATPFVAPIYAPRSETVLVLDLGVTTARAARIACQTAYDRGVAGLFEEAPTGGGLAARKLPPDAEMVEWIKAYAAPDAKVVPAA
jgi:hypothetical protein